MRGGWGRTGGRLLLAGSAIAVSLLAGEAVVRVVRPQELSLNHSRWDPDVGFTNHPGMTARTRTSEFDMLVRINSRGLRDREFSFEKPARTIRVGVFGDSYTFGHGVAAEETFPKVLERLANKSPKGAYGPRIEVLNFGIGKTGTSHQLAWYLKEGRRYRLDTVVLAFLTVNDFQDNWSGVHYLDEGDRLVHSATGYTTIRRLQSLTHAVPLYPYLATRSHLLNLLKRIAARADDRRRGARASERNSLAIAATEDAAAAREQALYGLTLRLVMEFRSRVTDDGAGFVFVGLPARGQRSSADRDPGEVAPEKVALYERLLGDLGAAGVDVVDLVPAFATVPVRTHYFSRDGHMRARGHERVARALLDALGPRLAAISPDSAEDGS